MLETGGLKSSAYRNLNNAFGIGGEGNLYQFETVADSIKWLKRWLNRKGLRTTYTSTRQYAIGLKNNQYFTADLQAYQDGLSRWFNVLDYELESVGQ